jgi:hypothetical protein
MSLSSDPRYLCAKASVYYWKKLGRTDPVAAATMAHWQGVLQKLRADHNIVPRVKKATGPKKPIPPFPKDLWTPLPLRWD